LSEVPTPGRRRKFRSQVSSGFSLALLLLLQTAVSNEAQQPAPKPETKPFS
jgi:hypothetical protein